jgi:hypothetical protein
MNNVVEDSLIQSSYANISHICSFSASQSLLHLTWQYTYGHVCHVCCFLEKQLL